MWVGRRSKIIIKGVKEKSGVTVGGVSVLQMIVTQVPLNPKKIIRGDLEGSDTCGSQGFDEGVKIHNQSSSEDKGQWF